MDNPIAVFRWVTLCAILWALFLCTGCASLPSEYVYENGYSAEVVSHGTQASLREALKDAGHHRAASEKSNPYGFVRHKDNKRWQIHVWLYNPKGAECIFLHERDHLKPKGDGLMLHAWHGFKSNSDCGDSND